MTSQDADVVGDRNLRARNAAVFGKCDGRSGAVANENADGEHEDKGAVPIDEDLIDGEECVSKSISALVGPTSEQELCDQKVSDLPYRSWCKYGVSADGGNNPRA